MRIIVAVKANARREAVEEKSPAEFSVCVREPAKEGKANIAVQKALAKHFHIAPSRIHLVSGAKSKRKIFMIT